MDAVFDLKKAYHLDVFMHMGSQGFFLVIIIIFLWKRWHLLGVFFKKLLVPFLFSISYFLMFPKGSHVIINILLEKWVCTGIL